MSNEINTGGPAFPLNWEQKGEFWAFGMTLRDYFAAKATEDDLQPHIWKGFNETKVKVAQDGRKYEVSLPAVFTREEAKYRYADAMMEAREPKNESNRNH
jgi:hypothetical protein